MRKRTFAIAAIATTMALFAIGYLATVRWLFPPLPEPHNGIVVPDLAGSTVESAKEKLRRLGLRLTGITEITHPTKARGVIIAQDPIPGQQLRDLGAVRVAISAGVPVVAQPTPAEPPRAQSEDTAPAAPDTTATADSISLRP